MARHEQHARHHLTNLRTASPTAAGPARQARWRSHLRDALNSFGLAVFMAAAPAALGEAQPPNDGKGYVQSRDTDSTAVWKGALIYDDAMTLLGAGVAKSNPSVVAPYAACIVPNGTRAVRVDTPRSRSGLMLEEVIIVEGAESGCRGVVTPGFWYPGEPPARTRVKGDRS
jgi:hypothetical protein